MDLNINDIINYLAKQPIIKAWIFGSYARGNYTPESDLDLIVQIDPDIKIGLFGFSKIARELQEITHKHIDLVEDSTLYEWVEENVTSEKILIYERTSA